MTRLKGYFLLVFIALNGFSLKAFAQQPTQLTLKQGAPTTYTVVKGDTLWDISAMYLNNPWLWPQLWDINSEIENPHLIYPGDQLYLVWNNGKPQLKFKPKVTLSPKVRKVKKQPVPIVEQGLVMPYLQSDRLINKEVLATSSKVIGDSEGHQYITQQDVLYFTGHHTQAQWGVYRPASEFERDKEVLVALRLIATGELVRSDETISTLRIKEQSQEVVQNDIVLPLVDIESLKLTTTFFPHPAPERANARILGALEGSQYYAQGQVVVLNQGGEDGLKQGCMFEVYNTGSHVFGSQGQFSYEKKWFDKGMLLPSKKVGELMVIRPYDKFSLALITRSQTAFNQDVMALSPLVANAALPLSSDTDN
ncbi:nucleoid-associated protein YgaU [Vibrio diazotrophicus]|uniref:Nucleoid-associated protein YgaU n=1 Tax=Vibrio diazotrophicus TaxID=685 RepID=A0A2J8GHD1_VIBDI|nr:LysM peptidoglycan-binding domain-containing protein [Vibrio diazotrophicus]PNH85413.1 peptidoglycan-binding protein [Vibrio diazotrophicus]RAS57050.1 nucleoid-associated protein YgaU [Vibrio diazotrophicus]